jgi:preprotein translocase subunit SecD
LTFDERTKRKFDYFLLLREPHSGKAITEKHIAEFGPAKDKDGRPVVQMRLTRAGSELMKDLSTENRPTENERLRRAMAIIVHGRVISHPHIATPFSDSIWISGNFTEAEVNALVQSVTSRNKK